MTQVWAARDGDRIRVQTEPFDLPGWEHRAGEVPDELCAEWQRIGGGQEADMWEYLTPTP